jgi:hypothetical protein
LSFLFLKTKTASANREALAVPGELQTFLVPFLYAAKLSLSRSAGFIKILRWGTN